MTATEQRFGQRLELTPEGADGADAARVVAEVWEAVRRARQRDGGGSSLTVRLARMTEQAGWLVTVPSVNVEELVGEVHLAAVQVAGEATLARLELDPQLKHRPPIRVQRSLREALKEKVLEPPEQWGPLLQLGLEVVYDLSRVAQADGLRRAARKDSGDGAAPLEMALRFLYRVALNASVIAGQTMGDRAVDGKATSEPTFQLEAEELSAPVEIADPEQELVGLRRRAETLHDTLVAAAARLATDGQPLPSELLDDLDRYGRDLGRLATALGAAPGFSALDERLLDRDPHRRALRALAELQVSGDDPLPAADDVRKRAQDALAAFDAGKTDSGIEALLWLHDWILLRSDPESARAYADTVMQQMTAARIPTTLWTLDADRLRLGAVEGAEPVMARAREPAAEAEQARPPAGAAATESSSRQPDAPETSPAAEAGPAEEQPQAAQAEASAPVPAVEQAPSLARETVEPQEKAGEATSVPPPEPAPTPTPEEPARDGAEQAPGEHAPVEQVEPALLQELVAKGWPGIAACYAPTRSLVEALELLALATAARSSSGDCAAELMRRIFSPQERLDETSESRSITFAAVMACATTAPASWVEEMLDSYAAPDCPALGAIATKLRQAVQQGFEIGRDYRIPDDTASDAQRRAEQLADDARRWLRRPGRMRMQRASRLWREWADEREGRLGRLLAQVAAQDTGDIAGLRERMCDFRENLDRYLKLDDRGLRGSGSSEMEGAARRELVQRCGEVLQLVDEAIQTWELLAERDRDTRERNPRAAMFGVLDEALSTQLAPARAEVARLAADGPLAAAALSLALDALERMVVKRGGLPADGEPPCIEALRGRLLACDLPLDDELQPLEPLTKAVAVEICQRRPDWGQAFRARVQAGELHHAWRIRRRLAAEPDCDLARLQAALDERAKRLEEELREQSDHARIQIDQSWRLGRLSHEACMRLFQELDAIEQRFDDPDTSLRSELAELDAATRAESAAHLAIRRDALHSELGEVGADPAVREAIERFLSEDDIASAEDAIQALRNGQPPILASDREQAADIREFMRLCAALDGSEPALEDVQAAVRGERELLGCDFAMVSERQSEDAIAYGFEQWYALRDDRSLSRGDRQPELRNHVHAILQLAGFHVAGLTQRGTLRTRGNLRAVDFEMKTARTMEEGLSPDFGTEARALRVVLLLGGRAGPDELLAATREDSELPCVALLPRTLTVKQRRRIGVLHREAPTTSPVMFIDTAALLFTCTRGAMDIAPTMRATLPFTAVNPYRPFLAGEVPPEIFFGRTIEIGELLAKEKSALVYGGRRLGKSALLHAVKRRAETSRDSIEAIYIDLKAAGIGERNPPSALLPLLIETLGRVLKAPPPPGRLPQEERLARVADAWLEQDERRRIIVLMDEADLFLQADADTGFETTNALQHLYEQRSQKRFKPILTGLHQVKRFNDVPNQRVTHLGGRVAVGPLKTTEALQLIEQPLGALGFAFEHSSAAHRILAATRNQPSLIQLVGHHLVRDLLSRPLTELPPYQVTRADVDAVLNRPSLAAEMHERLDLTLSLDSRYRVILLVIALDVLERSVERPLRARELQQRCEDWWPVGFADTTDYAFDALLEEMCELGLLYRDAPEGFRVQSRSVMRLLGTPEDIETSLLRAGSLHLPEHFNASTYRESLLTGPRRSHDRYRRSPLTVQQVEELRRRERRIVVVVGTDATGVRSVGEALEHTDLDEQRSGQQRGVTVLTESSADDPETQRAFLRQLRTAGRRSHKLVVLMRHPDSGGVRELILQGSRTVGGGKPAEGTVCGIVTVAATRQVAMDLLALTQGRDADGRSCIVMPLRRWDATGLRAWALDDSDGTTLPFAADRKLDELLAVTGGWPSLVDRVVTQVRGKRGAAFAQALRDLKVELASPEGAEQMLAAVGLRSDDSPEMAVWAALVDYRDAVPLTRSVALDVATLAKVDVEEDARVAYETLRLKDLLIVDEQTSTVSTEPVVAAAWRRLHES
jgi:hypothetical protein